MLKFTSIVGYTSCGPTYFESFLTIFGQCMNALNYKYVCLKKENMRENVLRAGKCFPVTIFIACGTGVFFLP